MRGKIKLTLIFFILLLIGFRSFGQYLPKDNAKLNYNQIMFEGPYVEKAREYTFFIAEDTVKNISENYLIKKTEKLPVCFIKGLPLGKQYKWCIETKLKNGNRRVSEMHYFAILTTKMANPKLYKAVQHYNKKEKTEDGIIWCDEYRCAVDRSGSIVWFLSEEQNALVNTKVLRDIKLCKDGTMTMIHSPNASRTDIDMNFIWRAPYEGTIAEAPEEDYHHEMEMLPNGNYMILGNEKIQFSNENKGETIISSTIDFCNIIEYNKNRDIVWFWRMKDYFPYELLINSNIKTPSGLVSPHANSFCYDQKNEVIYLSFRDISRIIKIDKKTKKIIASYGYKLKDEDPVTETNLFRLQHDIQLLSNNDMLLFNNNDIDSGKISCIEIIHLPTGSKDSLYLKWKFDLNYDSDSKGKVARMGGVKIMNNGNYLICEGSSNRVIEISPKGELLWDFSFRMLDSTGKINDHASIYRTNFSYSLYPYYFSFFITDRGEIIIQNNGYNSDSYEVLISDGKKSINLQTKRLKNGEVQILKPEIAGLKNMKIEIKSMECGKIRTNF